MDKAKITRKPSKTGKHEHGKRKSTKEAGKSSQSYPLRSHAFSFSSLVKVLQQKFDESFYEAWDRFNDLLRACPHHGFLELHQLDTFYNALNVNDQDSLNSAAGGNFLDKMPRECLRIIESKSKGECFDRYDIDEMKFFLIGKFHWIMRRSDPLHHEFVGDPLTLLSRNDHEFEEYLSLMTMLCEISTSRSEENIHANPSVVNDDFRDEDNVLPNLIIQGCQKPGHLAARLGCAETKVATWDDLAFSNLERKA
ncbi:hypothetical protein Tco_1531887, partial [Tanacetum coccineum]